MIEFSNTKAKRRAQSLIGYIRAGKKSVSEVKNDYYTGHRMAHIAKLWKTLRTHHVPENMTDADIEIAYMRWCRQFGVDHLVVLGEWKCILAVVAGRLDFFSRNGFNLPGTNVIAMDRALLLASVLRRGM